MYPDKLEHTLNAGKVQIDETGFFLNPIVPRSWSIILKTPVIDSDGGHRDQACVIKVLGVSPTAHQLWLYFATEPDGFFHAEKVIVFLRASLMHLRGTNHMVRVN